MKPIFIIGFMGAGKSTVGRRLAKAMGLKFVDTDLFIESRFRCSISKMFAEVGEERFRKREHIVTEELSGMEDCVIATGGGLPCFSGNMELLNDNGITIYLHATDHTLAQRLCICKRSRPAVCDLSEAEIEAFVCRKMQERRPIYETAQLHISVEQLTDKNDEEAVVAQIIDILKSCMDFSR